MAYKVTFQGQSLEEAQKAAFDYVKTVWTEFKVVNVFAYQSRKEASITIFLEKKEPKE